MRRSSVGAAPEHYDRSGFVVRFLQRLSLLALASDPGLNRLRMGLSGAVCVAAALAVEFAVATLLGVTGMHSIVFLLMGAVVAMMGSNALAGHEVWANVRTAVFFPVALGVGLLVGVLVSPNKTITLATFVVVMFIAVYIRRFGLNYFFYGFMIWMGFFFADFLHMTFAQVPATMLAIIVGTIVVLVLCITVFRPHPARTLNQIFRSMGARSQALAGACAALIAAGTDGTGRQRALKRVSNARARTRETALMSDGWAAHADSLPEGWSASGLRRRLLDRQLRLDRLVAASDSMAGESEAVRTAVSRAVRAYAVGDNAAAERECVRVETLAAEWDERARTRALHVIIAIRDLTATHTRVEAGTSGEDFEPAAQLALGNLPGSVSVAKDVAARGAHWNPLARLRLTTRQAIQVAIAGGLAIIAGSMLSEQRYYWAVITAFVAFTGTGTRFETVRKSFNRVLGTLLGLFAGILIAHLTTGHTLWSLVVIILSIFFGNYLVRISYAYMIFFITIMISQLYGILGEFSDQLLVLRLEETIIGASIGIIVALIVMPLSTRDTIDHAQRELLGSIADALTGAATRLGSPTAIADSELDALMFAIDANLRRIEIVAMPLTRNYLWERRPRLIRRQLAILAGCVSSARELVLFARAQSLAAAELEGAYRASADAFTARAKAEHADQAGGPVALPQLTPTVTTAINVLHPQEAVTYQIGRLNTLLSELDDR